MGFRGGGAAAATVGGCSSGGWAPYPWLGAGGFKTSS
jgi:hypothetical protein